MGIWYEVWGVEYGEDPPPVLLAKFPEEVGGEQAANQFKTNIEAAEGSQLSIRKVEDLPVQQYAKGHRRAPNKDHLIALDKRKRQQEQQDTQET